MAIKFKGDTTVAIINSIKKAEVDTVYRCFDSGVLLSNEVINHGDFVSWDGTKWIKRPDLSYLLDDTEHSIRSQIEDIQAVIPEGTSEENPLVNETGLGSVNSNIAPNYVKTTYEANSYVMHDGILYTNLNAIETAEDWTPAHWTRTTVADMLAGAGGTMWTNRETSVSIAGGNIEQIDIQDHEYVTLHVSHTGSSSNSILNLHLHGECYVELDKAYKAVVNPYIENAVPTHILNTGIVDLNKYPIDVLTVNSSDIPDEYDPEEFMRTEVLTTDTEIIYLFTSTNSTAAQRFLLHSLGNGTLIITPLPS